MTNKLYLRPFPYERKRAIADGLIPDCPLSPSIYAYKCAGSSKCAFYCGMYSIMGRSEVMCQLDTTPPQVYYGKQATKRHDKQLGELL